MERKSKILLVDDDVDVLETYGELLKKLPSNPEVFTANSGKLAISLLDSNEFDLLICDIKMPEMDGFQVLSIVRRRFPDLRIVAFTSMVDDFYRDRSYALGVDICWQKPANEKEAQMFLECIEGLLYQRSKEGFRGVQVKNLVDLIQLECMCGNSTTLKIKSGAIEAKIYFKEGEVIDAEIGNLRGEIAFKKILKLRSGTFEFLPVVPDRERTIFTSYHGLLLDAAQTIDEIQTDDKSQLPDVSEVGDRTALEKPIVVIGKMEGVDFIMEGDIEKGSIIDTSGVGHFDAFHSWATNTIKIWQSFSELFAIGHLQQIQAFNSYNSIVIEQSGNKYLCVGFKPAVQKDYLQELMKKCMALWVS